MPIDVETFEAIPDEVHGEREPKSDHAEAVESYLAERADRAFTLTELQGALDVPRGSIGVTLARLEDRGAVRHRGAYWAVAPDAEA